MARGGFRDRLTFGGRLPWSIGLSLVLLFGLSLPAAFITRHGRSLFELGALLPDRVWHGEVWRLLTWAFLQPSPLGLIFTALMFWWFGRPLVTEWDDDEVVRVFSGVLLAAGLLTCAIALVDPSVRMAPYLGSYALTAALVVAWGLTFPFQIVRIYFVLPIRGYWLAWGSVAVSVVFAIYSGWTRYVPELAAQAATLAWMYRDDLRIRLRGKKKRPPARPKPTRGGHLRVVPRDDRLN